MGIPVEECCYIYGDNQSILVNSSTPQSQLKKKSNSVAYHHVREGSTLDEWRVTYINTNDNLADLLTKNLPAGEKRLKFCQALLHFLTPTGENNEHAAAAALTVFPEEWITALVGALEHSGSLPQ